MKSVDQVTCCIDPVSLPDPYVLLVLGQMAVLLFLPVISGMKINEQSIVSIVSPRWS